MNIIFYFYGTRKIFLTTSKTTQTRFTLHKYSFDEKYSKNIIYFISNQSRKIFQFPLLYVCVLMFFDETQIALPTNIQITQKTKVSTLYSHSSFIFVCYIWKNIAASVTNISFHISVVCRVVFRDVVIWQNVYET